MSLLRSPVVQKPYQLFHYYFLSEKRPGNTLSDLSFETNPKLTINQFLHRSWSYREILHYSFLSSIIFFVFIIFPANFFLKLLILSAFITCFIIPLTSQFFVHALPIFTWLALFFSAGKIPTSWKPAISVKVLPAMETILYGDNLSNVLATITSTLLDIWAWLPYGLLHFSAPFVVAAFIFVFAPPTSLRSYGFAFGYMNLLGVMIQILFPAAPPWYKNSHGLEPANYSMSGSPGGLARIDELLGVDMYTSTFSNSPVVFGAFPSLHSGCSVMDVLFLCWLFPKYTVLWWGYASWLWWSTMYLTHHYFIDLIGGAALSFIVFNYTKYMHLPVINHKLFCRWSYTQIERIDIINSDPLLNYSANYNQVEDIEMGTVDNNHSLPGANFSYFYNKSVANDMPRLGSRSRQQSRADLSEPSLAVGTSRLRSTSSLSLGAHNEEEEPARDDVETFSQSSMEHSSVPSVFDGENYNNERRNISSNASNSSLDELIEEPTPTNNKPDTRSR
ncbi:inositol phosphorylceramide synthase [[Candida] railenensis]|uniref:Inositol phosphorylceramide synthase n=1 Tax=[Candida] railenensis TaxID=45579 RepID=A0A9P0QJ00_9ASCO|nr:inositol phosphorylceramide synthase [[Candida] railenensis]